MDRTVSTAFPRLAAAPVLAFAAAFSLGACQMTQNAADDGAMITSAPQAASGNSQRVIERDVEAPEVFQVDEAGLWDGRPSLGGVWVAHPTARDPERVLIRNTRTGATVIGALFRRERENPGPRFQVSSEAANALGILAGAPTDIEVTALRLQRVEMEIDPAPAPATAASETLAIAPVETAAPPVPAGAPQGQVAITEEEVEAPRRGLRDLFRRRTPDPEPAAIAQTTLAPAAGTTVAAVPQPSASAPAAPAPQAAAPQGERRGLFGLFRRREPEPAPDTTMIALPDVTGSETAAPVPVQPAAAPAQPAPRIDRPFVQIGIFSVEQNAINARAQMQQAGLTADIRRGQVGENQFWRVVVGPASSTAERGQMLQRVRGLGFADAYAVVR